MRIAAQKTTEEETISPGSDVRGPPTSRSSLSYQNSYPNHEVSLQRHIGISTSSTTSRSTCKTSSSNYRSDLRDLSTSTASRSSYESRHGKVLKSPYAYDSHPEALQEKEAGDMSGSEDSDDRPNMELASSHSSDEDETATSRSLSLNCNLRENRKPEISSKPSFMPNICEAGELTIPPPTPPHLTMSSNIRPLYSPAWSSQLPPPSYPLSLNYTSPGRWISERVSNTTASDSEQNSPNSSGHNSKRYSSAMQNKNRDFGGITNQTSQNITDGELSQKADVQDAEGFLSPNTPYSLEEDRRRENNLNDTHSHRPSEAVQEDEIPIPALACLEVTDSEYV